MIKYYAILFTFFLHLVTNAQNGPVARFTFNNGSAEDDVNKKHAKLAGINYTLDRFGNEDNAVFLSGNKFSYVNLGSYNELKQREGTISLWVDIEYKVWSGTGPVYNPIILTKNSAKNDFYEAFAIYYLPETEKLVAVTSQDDTREVGLFYMAPFERKKWHHLVIAWNDHYFWFYVNSKLEGKLPKNFETKYMENDSVMVGHTANVKNQRFLIGMVDDIEFYDRVLTGAEIEELYKAPNPNKNKIILGIVVKVLLLLLAVLALYFAIRYYVRSSIKKAKQRLELANKLLENELRINRALMNPHFIFNSLNTLHNYILTNNVEKASNYLLKFSKLIRKILDSNMSDTISLELEIELIQKYLEIEGLRFNEHIQHVIVVEPALIPSAITIPIMMIQPFVENSVWHGLREKKGDKLITISFSLYESKYIRCIIEDNGTGRKKREPNTTEKQSLGTGFIQHRLDMLNKIHGLHSSLKIIDKPDGAGTIVELILPILNK